MGSQPGSMMLWAGNSIGEGSSFSSIGPIMQLHGMELLGFPKVSNFPRDAHLLPTFVKFSLLILGVDAKDSTCPGNLTSGQPMSLHSTGDRTSFLLPGMSTKVPPFGKGQGTLLVETGTMDTGLLDASGLAGTIGLGEW